MFVVQIDFDHPEGSVNAEAVDSLLALWSKNGQLLEYPSARARVGTGIQVTGIVAERDSLEDTHANSWVRRDLDALKAAGVAVRTTVVGEHAHGVPTCGCATATDLVLYTDHLAEESPLRCLECFGQLPLYRFPPIEGEEHLVFVQWRSDYRACDSLQMGCQVGERFGERQLGALDSALSRSGRSLCAELEKRAGRRVFYYLYKSNGRSLAAERRRRCPSCEGTWLLAAPHLDRFDFRCDPCRLLGNIGCNGSWVMEREEA